MDSSTLDRLASGGFQAVPVSAFPDLQAWCSDWCVQTGDSRYCIISNVLGRIYDWFGEQGVPTALVVPVETQLMRGLTDALTSPDAASGAHFAREMNDALPLYDPNSWEEHGLRRRPDE